LFLDTFESRKIVTLFGSKSSIHTNFLLLHKVP
jgi:hypothetical protein